MVVPPALLAFLALVSLWLPACRASITTYPAGLRTLDSLSTPAGQSITLDRHFESGEGYHRTLVTAVRLTDVDASPETRCSLLLRETLPHTLYFDLYQLAELYRFHRAADRASPNTYPESIVQAYSVVDVELERSAEDSSEYTVWLFVPHAQWTTTAAPEGGQVNTATVRVPIHARYQAARDGGGYAEASMEPPTVYVRCDGIKYFSSVGWQRQQYRSTPSQVVRLQVPVGDLAHLPLVRVGTFVVTMGAAVALCLVVWWQARKPTASGGEKSA